MDRGGKDVSYSVPHKTHVAHSKCKEENWSFPLLGMSSVSLNQVPPCLVLFANIADMASHLNSVDSLLQRPRNCDQCYLDLRQLDCTCRLP
jgi:hypothetical protein